jgi:hypothetical protein
MSVKNSPMSHSSIKTGRCRASPSPPSSAGSTSRTLVLHPTVWRTPLAEEPVAMRCAMHVLPAPAAQHSIAVNTARIREVSSGDNGMYQAIKPFGSALHTGSSMLHQVVFHLRSQQSVYGLQHCGLRCCLALERCPTGQPYHFLIFETVTLISHPIYFPQLQASSDAL